MTIPIPEPATACWPFDPSCLGDKWSGITDVAVKERSRAMAERTLERLTLGRVGGCPVTVRPCRPGAAQGLAVQPYGQSWVFPTQGVDGEIRNCLPCGAPCTSTCEIDMGTVVGRVDEIKIDGTVLDIEGKLAVRDNRIIVWRGGGQCPFPTSNNMDLADSEDGTWSITYLPAHPVDAYGAYALAVLALEFAKACVSEGGNNCRLPKNVTQVVRRGVTLNLVPGLFVNGFTGINEIDTFIAEWNPRGAKQNSTIWYPGMVDHPVEVML